MYLNAALFLGFVSSQLTKYPSKAFLTLVVASLTLLSWYLGTSFAPIVAALPSFFEEWWQNRDTVNHLAYFVLIFYVVLMAYSISSVKKFAFLSACHLKNKYNTCIVP